MVLRLQQDNRGRHKLSPPWEGPYIIAEVLKPGTYKLANEKGEVLTNASIYNSYVASILKTPSFLYICPYSLL